MCVTIGSPLDLIKRQLSVTFKLIIVILFIVNVLRLCADSSHPERIGAIIKDFNFKYLRTVNATNLKTGEEKNNK